MERLIRFLLVVLSCVPNSISPPIETPYTFTLTDYDAYGPRLTLNNDIESIMVLAQNEFQQFSIGYNLFDSSQLYSSPNIIMYNSTDDYIESVAMSQINSSFFVCIGENVNASANDHFISVIDAYFGNCLDRQSLPSPAEPNKKNN